MPGDEKKEGFGVDYDFMNWVHDLLPEGLQKAASSLGLTDALKRASGGVDSNGERSENPLFDKLGDFGTGEFMTKYGYAGAGTFLFLSLYKGWDYKWALLGAGIAAALFGKVLGLTGVFNENAADTDTVDPAAINTLNTTASTAAPVQAVLPVEPPPEPVGP